MKANFEKVRSAILEFENKNITLNQVINLIFELTQKDVTGHELLNYWRSESIDDYVNRLIAEPIKDWVEINDKKALILIQEILDNIGDEVILETNSQALEKRYSKSSGTITDWIFQDDILDAPKILELLKENTTLLL